MLKSFQYNITYTTVFVFSVLCVISLFTIEITKKNPLIQESLKKVLVPEFQEGKVTLTLSQFSQFAMKFQYVQKIDVSRENLEGG